MTSHHLTPLTLPTIAATPAVLRAMLGAVAAHEATELVDAGGWTARDIVAHLLDRWAMQCQRLDAMLAEDHPTLHDEDEGASLERSGLLARPLEWLLAELERARGEGVARYQALTPALLARTGEHSAAGPVSVAEMLNHIAYHDLDHVRQVTGILAGVVHESRGAMQRF